VAHACNPSYSRGRHQENHGSNQPRQIVFKTILNLHTKGWYSGSGVDLEFKSHYCKKKKKVQIMDGEDTPSSE
jgi:hypothetical protein